MANTVYLRLLTSITICIFCGVNAFGQTYEIVAGDMNCPTSHRLISASLVKADRERICNLLQDWGTYRVSGWASLEGNALNCKINYNDRRTLKYSLCIKHQSTKQKKQNTIRGVLLFGGFRTQNELNLMSTSDWREDLITELSNRTQDSKLDYTLMDNSQLMGAGNLLIYLMKTRQYKDQELAKLTRVEIREIVVDHVFVQTGISRQYLTNLNDEQLIEYLTKG